MSKPFTIGQLAHQAGVNIETVRYYQRIGLIVEPPKPATGFRSYPPDTVDRIRFIKRAQQLGFSLQEITELLQLGEGDCTDVREHAEQKRAQIDEQIRDLKMLRRTLDDLISACQNGRDTQQCPIVQTLTGKKR